MVRSKEQSNSRAWAARGTNDYKLMILDDFHQKHQYLPTRHVFLLGKVALIFHRRLVKISASILKIFRKW